MSIRAVFFDFDDTLCQTTASRPELARHAAQVLLPYVVGWDINMLMEWMLQMKPDGMPTGPSHSSTSLVRWIQKLRHAPLRCGSFGVVNT